MVEKLHKLMPEGTRFSQATGGFLVWMSLPGGMDTLKLLDKTVVRGVSFTPGVLFSASNKYNDCLRINCSMEFDDRVENALKVLTEEVYNML